MNEIHENDLDDHDVSEFAKFPRGIAAGVGVMAGLMLVLLVYLKLEGVL